MRWPWSTQNAPIPSEPPRVVRPPSDRPITEFEIKRLEEHGRWLTIQIQVTPKGSWVNWHHDIPEELREEAKDALIALAIKLQDRR